MGILKDKTKKGEYFVYRQLATTDEFEDALRLRYYVYRSSGLESLIPEAHENIDFDAYDLHARHFGLFRVYDGTELPVGYLRVVEDRDLQLNNGILGLIDRFPSLGRFARARLKHSFPLMGYHPQASAIGRYYRGIRQKNEKLVEACRLVLDPCFHSLRLGQHIVESTLAANFIHFHYEHAMWCCDSSHAGFYKRYGLQRMPGTRDSDFLGIGRSSCCLFASAEDVPRRMRLRIARMAEAYGRTGRIACHPAEPLCFTEKTDELLRYATAMAVSA